MRNRLQFFFSHLMTITQIITEISITLGKQLQRIIHYSASPCRPLQLQSCLRRNDPNALYDVDCDEVYPRVYIGDA